MVVCATEREAQLYVETYGRVPILITGVGGVNVIEALKNIPRSESILNFGFAGSQSHEVGTIVRVGECYNLMKRAKEVSKVYELNGDVTCVTVGDFTEEGQFGVVYDMELAYICALGFAKVESKKYISDNLSYTEYERN